MGLSGNVGKKLVKRKKHGVVTFNKESVGERVNCNDKLHPRVKGV
jgi:hypothetical protein